MATTPKAFFDPALLTTGAVTYYTVPSSTVAIIKHLSLHNTSASPVQVTVNLVESGGTAGASNQVYKRTLAALESTQVFPAVNATLESGATIQALAATGSVVAIFASGNEVT